MGVRGVCWVRWLEEWATDSKKKHCEWANGGVMRSRRRLDCVYVSEVKANIYNSVSRTCNCVFSSHRRELLGVNSTVDIVLPFAFCIRFVSSWSDGSLCARFGTEASQLPWVYVYICTKFTASTQPTPARL